jgi:hypothetical protein
MRRNEGLVIIIALRPVEEGLLQPRISQYCVFGIKGEISEIIK